MTARLAAVCAAARKYCGSSVRIRCPGPTAAQQWNDTYLPWPSRQPDVLWADCPSVAGPGSGYRAARRAITAQSPRCTISTPHSGPALRPSADSIAHFGYEPLKICQIPDGSAPAPHANDRAENLDYVGTGSSPACLAAVTARPPRGRPRRARAARILHCNPLDTIVLPFAPHPLKPSALRMHRVTIAIVIILRIGARR